MSEAPLPPSPPSPPPPPRPPPLKPSLEPVVQVLRFCVPFRQSGFASFVDFFLSLALLAVVLSLFSVF